MKDNPYLVRQERELNAGWMKANPELVVASLLEFADMFRDEPFTVSLDISRKGYLTLIADRVEPEGET